MKRCPKCEEMKPLDQFGGNRSRPDGKAFYCKICTGKITKKWDKDNPENKKERKKKYRQSHQDQENAYRRKWLSEHPGYYNK